MGEATWLTGRDGTAQFLSGTGRDGIGECVGNIVGNRSRIRSGNAVRNGWEHDGELGIETAAGKEGNVNESCTTQYKYICVQQQFQ